MTVLRLRRWIWRPAPARPGAPWRALGRDFSAELGLAAAGSLIYFLIRGAVAERADEAFARAADLLSLQDTLGLSWELDAQRLILPHPALIDLANTIYFWGHMPLIVVMGIWLFLRHRRVYLEVRNAFLVSALIALLAYFTLPLAPPRLLPELGFVDTLALHASASYQASEVGPFVNPYAALPSLHFGWALLLGVAAWRLPGVGPRRALLIALAVLLPVSQAWAVLATANHFVLDVVAGGAVAVIGLAAAARWPGRPARDTGQQRAP